MKIKNDLGKLAVVIPSRNRQDYLLRSIKFWSNTNAKIYIVDGSKKSISSNKVSTFGKNIKYYYIDKTLTERLLWVSSKIEEPFVCLISDDEFHIPSALKSCITLLEKKTDYVSCLGRGMVFGYSKQDKKIKSLAAYPEMKDYELNQELPSERLNYHFKNYTPSQIYSVCRSRVWKIAMQGFGKEEFHFFPQMEMQFEMTLSYAGKSVVIPELMWLRSYENERIYDSEPGLTSDRGIIDFWRDKNLFSERQRYIEVMYETLKKVSDGSHEKIKKDIVDGIESFCEFHDEYLTRTNQIVKKGIFPALKKSFLKFIPKKIKNFIKKIILPKKVTKLNLNINEFIYELNESSVKVNRKELYEIELMVKEFHEG